MQWRNGLTARIFILAFLLVFLSSCSNISKAGKAILFASPDISLSEDFKIDQNNIANITNTIAFSKSAANLDYISFIIEVALPAGSFLCQRDALIEVKANNNELSIPILYNIKERGNSFSIAVSTDKSLLDSASQNAQQIFYAIDYTLCNLNPPSALNIAVAYLKNNIMLKENAQMTITSPSAPVQPTTPAQPPANTPPATTPPTTPTTPQTPGQVQPTPAQPSVPEAQAVKEEYIPLEIETEQNKGIVNLVIDGENVKGYLWPINIRIRTDNWNTYKYLGTKTSLNLKFDDLLSCSKRKENIEFSLEPIAGITERSSTAKKCSSIKSRVESNKNYLVKIKPKFIGKNKVICVVRNEKGIPITANAYCSIGFPADKDKEVPFFAVVKSTEAIYLPPGRYRIIYHAEGYPDLVEESKEIRDMPKIVQYFIGRHI